MAADDKIELIIEGLPEDEGRVRLSAFLSQLQNLSAALSKFDRESNDGKAASVFEISSISSNSPVSVILEPRPIASQRFIAGAIVERFKFVADALSSEKDLSAFDADLLEDIRALAKPVGKTVKSATVYFNGTALNLNSQIADRVDKALAIEDECDGSIEGMLEQINVHQGANTFHIYPDIGPKKVTCHFPATLLEDAVAAVGRKVEVFGVLKYRIRAPFAHQIAVRNLEAFPSDYDLPDWDDLRGRAPDATGALSSEDFVRELRDAW
jgi:hypothetical protein